MEQSIRCKCLIKFGRMHVHKAENQNWAEIKSSRNYLKLTQEQIRKGFKIVAIKI